MPSSSTGVSAGPPPSAVGGPAVQVREVSKRFGPTIALDRVGLTVADGDSHALVGRNGAGKSTLVSLLTGMQAPDSGEITLRGAPTPALADRDAWRRLVACVYQKSTIIPTLSVAENLFLNRQDRGIGGAISWRAVRSRAQDLLDEWDVRVDVDRAAADLGVEQRQLVEIARAVSFGARFIILDEPTAQLDAAGIERLFSRLRDLQAHGVTLLYISHHLEEIYQVCQTVTVFRDARHIVTAPVSDLPQQALIAAMTGEAARTEAVGRSSVRDGDPVLRVDRLQAKDGFTPTSFQILPGEVVGITGSASSGRIALAETIVGLRRADSGTVTVAGRVPRPGSVRDALDAGIGLVPRDRHHDGFVPGLSIAENMTMTIPARLGRAGVLSLRRRDRVARELISELSIVTSGPDQDVASLSGGNQQKVVMGRALAGRPRVLVLMHPTAGVDVRSKQTLLDVVEQVRQEGAGVLIVSDELEDLRPCDRVLVMRHGTVVREFARGWDSPDLIAAVEGLVSHDEGARP